eukprot:CAMPEP_0119109096 /NCGR_PEP_ID=MMETSP1180-20130426/17198_1 /TAXON_ID=3052 ORGANISM="Chlamydomonas cf sp, Strain CCMP681" /NCGR_SAMPLE_ID=MMETSP1180 /ASSEMBLY_ACC=CAM_ASM_000741 /LENGTH=137 /DNA_ID=CAMNT_0007094809 /DNA_START=84 /DNA_END=497 /DNA_ORIENTATION=-
MAESTATTVFAKLGGAPAIEAAVPLFYVKVLADPLLAPFFEGIPMARQTKKQIAFLSHAFGGPSRYNDDMIIKMHKPMMEKRGMGLPHFDAVANHLVTTLKDMGVEEGLINEAAAVVLALRPMFDPEIVLKPAASTA